MNLNRTGSAVCGACPWQFCFVLLAWRGTVFGSDGPYIGVVNGSEVKVRTGASHNHHAFSFIRMGQRIVVEREVNGWCRILIPRWIPVFVHKNYVEVRGERGVVKAGELNVRAQPNRTHEALGSLHSGTEVQILSEEEGGDWLRIVAPANARAFVSQRYLSKEKEIGTEDLVAQHAMISQGLGPRVIVGSGRESESIVVSGAGRPHAAGGYRSAALRKAETNFAEVALKNPQERDFSEVKATYQEIAGTSEDRAEISAAEAGLKKIEDLDQRKMQLIGAERTIAEVDRINQELDEQVRHARIAGRGPREDAEAYLARGWVTGINRFHGYQGTHRLMKGNQVLYYLKSEDGRGIPLDLFLNKRVGVRGVIRELDPKVGANLIVVSEITVLADR